MLWAVPLMPLLGAALVLAWRPRQRYLLALCACLTLLTSLALAGFALLGNWQGGLQWSPALRLQLSLTPVSATLAILVPLVALPVLTYGAANEEGRGLPRLMGLLLAFVGAMQLLVTANDLLTLIIGWEAVGACSWALISHHWRDRANPGSGLYAFVLTRFCDLGLFVAAMMAYSATGSFAFAALGEMEGAPLQLLTAGILLSACAKAGQLPFSPWLFRAMDGPTPVSALLHAATMVAAGAYLLIRLQPVLAPVEWFGPSAVTIGLMTALAGGVVALLQPHAKKLLAASTSAHYGLMLVAVGAGYPTVALLHLVVHACFKAALFLAAGSAGRQAGTYLLQDMRCGRGLWLAAAGSALGTAALAGLPPLGGGWTKDMIIAAVHQLHPTISLLVIVAGGLSAAYAARFHISIYGPGGGKLDGRQSRAERTAMIGLASLTLVSSLLWLPTVHDAVARALSGSLPHPKPWELPASLLAVALGLYGGYLLATGDPQRLALPPLRGCAEWLGLPRVIDGAIARPVSTLANSAARVDEQWLDRLPRSAAGAGLWMSAVCGRADRSVVDKGVAMTGAVGDALARLSGRWGEAVSDGLPELSARLIGDGAQDSRRLQTGLSHHYYAGVSVGALILFSVMWLGSG